MKTPISLIFGSLLIASGAFAVNFSTDFESGVPTEFSGLTLTSTITGQPDPNFSDHGFGTQFYYGGETDVATLTLTGVSAGEIDLSFDLAIIDSWDGDNNPGEGFVVEVNDAEVFNFSFSNTSGGSDTQSYPVAGSSPGTGSFVSGLDLFNGGISFADSAYTITLPSIVVTGGTLTIEFFGTGLQGITNESWAIDNVSVVPEPSAFALIFGATAVAFAGLRRRRQK